VEGEYAMNNEWVIAIIFFVIGLIPTYYFYRKSLRIKEPIYSIGSRNVISDYSSKYKNLTVSYKNEKVENFTVSRVLFFNHGAMTLDRNDIATRNQLRIIAKSGNILDATVLQVNNPSSDFKVSLDRANGSIIVEFDYLNQDHGAVIEVIHTGLASKDIELVGDIKQVKSLKRLLPMSLGIVPTSRWRRLVNIAGTLSMALILGIYLVSFFQEWISATAFGPQHLFLIVGSLLFSWMSWHAIVTRDYLNLKPALPRGLERFFEKD